MQATATASDISCARNG